jgi:TruD family tRNA pseudouridine synthase
MKFNKSPETFKVEEVLAPEIGEGKYFYYVLEKQGIATSQAVRVLEKQNNARIFVSGMKDAAAATMQWVCSEKKLENADKRMELLFMGNSAKRIYAGMHTSNKFTVVLEDVDGNARKILEKEIRREAFPNYFDEQRFSPKNLEIAKMVLQEDWKGTVKTALTESSEFESEKSRAIKKIIAEKWGKWKELAADLELPLPKRRIFEMLEVEGDFKKAFGMLPRKAIGIYCRVCQALQFNEMLKKQINAQNSKWQKYISIGNEEYPSEFKYKALKREFEIPAIFPTSTILKRKTFFKPKNAKVKFENGKATLQFELKKGCYATVLVKCLLVLAAGK